MKSIEQLEREPWYQKLHPTIREEYMQRAKNLPMNPYEHIALKTASQMKKIKHLIGNTYKDGADREWILHSCNDLGILYFKKPKTKGRNTYYLRDLETIKDLAGKEINQ